MVFTSEKKTTTTIVAYTLLGLILWHFNSMYKKNNGKQSQMIHIIDCIWLLCHEWVLFPVFFACCTHCNQSVLRFHYKANKMRRWSRAVHKTLVVRRFHFIRLDYVAVFTEPLETKILIGTVSTRDKRGKKHFEIFLSWNGPLWW